MLIILTASSMLLALIMSVVAWRATRDERRRSDARVEALAREIHAVSGPPEIAVPLGSDLFAPPAQSGSRWGLVLAVGAFGVALIAAFAVVFGGDPSTTTVAAAPQSAPQAQPAAAPAPLELLALTHERDGQELTVRGVVRNPSSGTEMERLTVVVSLYNHEGSLLRTGRAPVTSPSLIPGGESTFSVTVQDAADVSRYRVGFQADERILSHVDKRNAP